MEKTTIYVIALVVGGILGIISTLSRKKGKTSGHNSGSKDILRIKVKKKS